MEKQRRKIPVAKKHDQGKDRWDLLPIGPVQYVVKVLGFGAAKYGPNQWQDLPEAEDRYYAATLRHLAAWREGEKVDKESGLPALAHAICCLIFLLWHDSKKKSFIKRY